ncbi:MAG: DUF167 domain-containing protein [Candidatus Omnitrophota bacterium]|jgi:hypothetical protein|nr:DUF167 domain-containing protein [Candidatus Omnitrophota bacterium]
MKITVKVKAGAKQAKIEELSENSFSVWVKEKPQEGKANYAVREALADYFNIPKSRVTLISGEKSKTKLFEIS